MNYKIIFFFVLFATINTPIQIYAMQQNPAAIKYNQEEIKKIASEINYNRNDLINRWMNGDIDPFSLSSPMPCSPFQTTPSHIILLLEHKKQSIVQTRNPRLIDVTLKRIEQNSQLQQSTTQ